MSSLRAQRRLAESGDQLARTSERLASGQRINRPSDDAASLAVALTLNANARVYGQGVRNINDGLSLLNVADSGLEQLSQLLQRNLELATQASTGTYSTAQRLSLDREAQQLRNEYNRIIQGTSFNGRTVLQGSGGQLNIQAGIGSSAIYNADVIKNVTRTVGTSTGTGSYTNYTTPGLVGQTLQTAEGDFNGDGRTDIAVLSANGTDLYFELYTADAQGQMVRSYYDQIASRPSSPTSFTWNIDEYSLQLGDANGDGFADVGVYFSYYGEDGTSDARPPASVLGNVTYFADGGGTFSRIEVASSFSALPSSIIDFNGDGVADTYITPGGTSLQTNVQNTTITYSTVTELESLTLGGFSLFSQASAKLALGTFTSALEAIRAKRGDVGGIQSRLQVGLSNLQTARDAFLGAASRISDADVAMDAAAAVRSKILQEVAASILGQANQSPRIALDILRNA